MEVNGNALHTRMEHGVGANISGTYIVTIDDTGVGEIGTFSS